MWTKGLKGGFWYACVPRSHVSEEKQLTQLLFFPIQGGSGDYYPHELKGEQGVLGFVGFRVNDLNDTGQYT